ncbi:MAG: hypothetical protein ABJF28_00150, partial [Nisaea sp.]|uniref:hypothetical protein n=1 Tax=Nisaea sp. TaxID=2024842 RepID=UPI003266FAA0
NGQYPSFESVNVYRRLVGPIAINSGTMSPEGNGLAIQTVSAYRKRSFSGLICHNGMSVGFC